MREDWRFSGGYPTPTVDNGGIEPKYPDFSATIGASRGQTDKEILDADRRVYGNTYKENPSQRNIRPIELAGGMQTVTSSVDSFPTKEVTRETAKSNLSDRLQRSAEERAKVARLKFFKMATAVGLTIVVAGSMAGIVTALSKNLELTDELIKTYSTSQTELNELKEETGIIPTEEEYNAGLTADQLLAKRQADEEAVAEQNARFGR